ncbi:hypothetical protein O3P69_009912 [Scylla paramamosain]|uniref:Uncharacterized protein n=1 Tax=Scylla paramamosain TaxID=85552 RepID=A0AAW0SNE6_SCYPA
MASKKNALTSQIRGRRRRGRRDAGELSCNRGVGGKTQERRQGVGGGAGGRWVVRGPADKALFDRKSRKHCNGGGENCWPRSRLMVTRAGTRAAAQTKEEEEEEEKEEEEDQISAGEDGLGLKKAGGALRGGPGQGSNFTHRRINNPLLLPRHIPAAPDHISVLSAVAVKPQTRADSSRGIWDGREEGREEGRQLRPEHPGLESYEDRVAGAERVHITACLAASQRARWTERAPCCFPLSQVLRQADGTVREGGATHRARDLKMSPTLLWFLLAVTATLVAGEETQAAKVGKDDTHDNSTVLSPAEELLQAARKAGYELTLERLDEAVAASDEQVNQLMPAPVAEAFISLRRNDNIDVIREKMIGMIFTGQPRPLGPAPPRLPHQMGGPPLSRRQHIPPRLHPPRRPNPPPPSSNRRNPFSRFHVQFNPQEVPSPQEILKPLPFEPGPTMVKFPPHHPAPAPAPPRQNPGPPPSFSKPC